MNTKEIIEKAHKNRFEKIFIYMIMDEIEQHWDSKTQPPKIEVLIREILSNSEYNDSIYPNQEELLEAWNGFVSHISQKLQDKSILISKTLSREKSEIKMLENTLKSSITKIKSEIEMKEFELRQAKDDYEEFTNFQFIHELNRKNNDRK